MRGDEFSVVDGEYGRPCPFIRHDICAFWRVRSPSKRGNAESCSKEMLRGSDTACSSHDGHDG